MKFFINHFLLLFFTTGLFLCSSAQESKNKNLHLSGGGWSIISSTQVKEGGEIISTSSFRQEDWYSASVPTTVLNALVKDSIYPDPRTVMNNVQIADVSDAFIEKHG